MNDIPVTDSPLIVRTDFSDQGGWESLTAVVSKPAEPFVFNMEFLEEQENDEITAEEVVAALPEDYPHPFIVIADPVALSDLQHPLLVVDLMEEPGRQFRAVAALLPSIENNLSVGNMSFAEFAEATEGDGVFRGFPEN